MSQIERLLAPLTHCDVCASDAVFTPREIWLVIVLQSNLREFLMCFVF